MRSMLRTLVLTATAISATSAFAATQAVVNVPFSFQTHGHSFAAGQYSVSLDSRDSLMTLRDVNNVSTSMRWVVSPADYDPNHITLTMKFDDAGFTHELHSVQLGSRVTSVLDAPAKHHDAGSIVAAVSGQ